ALAQPGRDAEVLEELAVFRAGHDLAESGDHDIATGRETIGPEPLRPLHVRHADGLDGARLGGGGRAQHREQAQRGREANSVLVHFFRPAGLVTVTFSRFRPGLTSNSMPDVWGFANFASTAGRIPWASSLSPRARATTITRYLPGAAPSPARSVPQENDPSDFTRPWTVTLVAPSPIWPMTLPSVRRLPSGYVTRPFTG